MATLASVGVFPIVGLHVVSPRRPFTLHADQRRDLAFARDGGSGGGGRGYGGDCCRCCCWRLNTRKAADGQTAPALARGMRDGVGGQSAASVSSLGQREAVVESPTSVSRLDAREVIVLVASLDS